MFYKTVPLIVLPLFFIACGGASEHEPREEKTIYFIDSPTNGINYSCGERQGITKTLTIDKIEQHGVITCVYSPIELYLGSLYLGKIENIQHNQKIYPQNLVPSFDGNFNNEALLKIAILIQSLDDKKHPDYINIPEPIKSQIQISDLNALSIAQLYKQLESMDITPVKQKDAKLHLILHSENTNSGKPKINAFEEDISTSLHLGDSIGKISIDEGDGTLLLPFILEGKDKENFVINDDGTLQLVKILEEEKTLNLTVTASNEFGFSKKEIILHVSDDGKIGKVQLGRLKSATVKLFELNPLTLEQELITTEISKSKGSLNQIGNFNLNSNLLKDDSFYIYEVSEGEDIDSNDDGIRDNKAIQNKGVLRLIAKGSWIKYANHKIRITPLSEMIFSYLRKNDFEHLDEKLEEYSKILLEESINYDLDISPNDIIIFNPIEDKSKLYPTLKYKNTYNKIKDKIREGDETYKNTLFDACMIQTFQSNALEIVDSFVYTVDMIHTGEFSIHHLKTNEKIGSLKLPETPYAEDTHVMYVNLQSKEVTISSLKDWSYEISIINQKKPILIDDPFITYSILSGSINKLIIGKSNTLYFFSQNQKLYSYTIGLTDNNQQFIQVFTTTKNSIDFLYKFETFLLAIDSLWINKEYCYVVGDNKLQIFKEKDKRMQYYSSYNNIKISGHILGIEKEILYILDNKVLTLIDIHFKDKPRFIEKLNVPFSYKLGVKTNGEYITTGSKIIDIKTLRATKKAN